MSPQQNLAIKLPPELIDAARVPAEPDKAAGVALKVPGGGNATPHPATPDNDRHGLPRRHRVACAG